MENSEIYALCNEFGIDGDIVGVSILTSGHINTTFNATFSVDNTTFLCYTAY